MKKLRVADFFCGAGGFSEGFRQVGFDVAFALDNWNPAIETHRFNHPGCSHSDRNILDIGPMEIDEIIPDTEVMIGSPPCVSFSGSNKAGNADKSLGLMLIESFLRIIAHKKNKEGSILKYWILENVPNAQRFMNDAYTFKELGLKGGKRTALRIPVSEIYNAADFGAPQTRSRMFCGDFPKPVETIDGNEHWVTLGKVLESLDPKRIGNRVTDINHGFSICGRSLTDHFYDTSVREFEWRNAKRLKRDHGFMGRMSFPEDESRPSRTIMATRSASTREAMILADRSGKGYRMPTIREVSSLMSFPITYQFMGNGESTKYKLVGNAVCPKMAAALARAMLNEEGMKESYRPNPHPRFKMPPFDLNGQKRTDKRPQPRRISARFRMHVPYIKIRSFRVDLDNLESDFEKERVAWRSVLHYGSGKAARHAIIDNKVVEKSMVLVPGFIEFKDDVMKTFIGNLPGPKDFQMSYCRLTNGDLMGPEEALAKVKKIVDKHFPEHAYSDGELRIRIRKMDKYSVPLRVVAALYACNIITGAVMSTF